MRKNNDEEENKNKNSGENKNQFTMDFSKYQPFLDEIVQNIYNLFYLENQRLELSGIFISQH